MAAAQGQYTFLVDPGANKVEIAEAISYIFDVDVQRVRIINRAAKFGRWGRKRVKRQVAQKKAVVTLPPGQHVLELVVARSDPSISRANRPAATASRRAAAGPNVYGPLWPPMSTPM